ncbi:MAG TPA: copper chaperone PCu(A)C, partial [Herpetosiphonaceae bacterium]
EAWARPVALGAAPADATAPMTATEPLSGTMGGGMGGGMGGAMAGSNSAAYMRIANAGAAERLVKAESPVAGTVELHTVEDQNGVMAMRPVAAIEIPAQGSAELKPGGFHVMLIDVQRELRAGDTFTVTLTFEQAGAVTVPVTVRDPASR